MNAQTQNTMKTLSKSIWTNLKTGVIILAKELCWMAGGFSHKMEIRQLQKQARQEEAAFGRRLLEALEEARQHLEDGATPSIPTPKDAEAIRERILFIREEIIRLEKLRIESRKHHEAKIRDRFQQDEKEAEAAEPVVWDIPDIPYTPDIEGFEPEKTNPTMNTTAGKIPEAQTDTTPSAEATPKN